MAGDPTPALKHFGPPLATARRVLIVLPGALTPLSRLRPVAEQDASDIPRMEMAFPGLDGRPLDHPVWINAAARNVALYLAQSPVKRVDIVGFSAGAAIALELRGLLNAPQVVTALISAPAPVPGMILPAMRFSADVVQIALRQRTIARERIWRDAFDILLYGRDGGSPVRSDPGKAIAPAITPTLRMMLYHGAGVALWRPSRTALAARGPVRFFHGAADTISPLRAAERLAARLHDADLMRYPGAGHLAHLARPDLFDDIRGFRDQPSLG
ncbi:MAG: alpha/beta fold hydrolase [Marinibacterium sp.]